MFNVLYIVESGWTEHGLLWLTYTQTKHKITTTVALELNRTGREWARQKGPLINSFSTQIHTEWFFFLLFFICISLAVSVKYKARLFVVLTKASHKPSHHQLNSTCFRLLFFVSSSSYSLFCATLKRQPQRLGSIKQRYVSKYIYYVHTHTHEKKKHVHDIRIEHAVVCWKSQKWFLYIWEIIKSNRWIVKCRLVTHCDDLIPSNILR